MFRKNAQNGHTYGRVQDFHTDPDGKIFSERNIGLYGLLLSLLIIATKLFYSNSEYINKAIFERKLVSYQVFNEEGEVMLTYAWKKAVRYSYFWLPALCGMLTTYFTWMMVYLDSNVPGIQPPSPLSPQKYKVRSGHSFHLNYIFAFLLGFLVFFYMIWKGISIEY